MIVTTELAASILPILQRHAAIALRSAAKADPRRAVLARALREGTAGGNAIEGLNQNTDDTLRESFPAELDTFWRVLVAFEEIAMGGHLVGSAGKLSLNRGEAEQPYPWMLHAAADAIALAIVSHDAQAMGLRSVVAPFNSAVQPGYKPLAWPMSTDAC